MPTLKDRSLTAEGKAIVQALGGRWSGIGGLCRCPAHDDRSPSLSVRVGRTRLLLHCFAGCQATEILKALQADDILQAQPGAADLAASLGQSANDFAKGAMRLWSSARLIAGTSAERYLQRRGVPLGSPALRFHPRAPLGPKPVTVFRPALIAAVHDETGLTGVHRTFLGPRGRLADLPEPKLALGRLGSGAVRLFPAAPRLGLAEGLETALSAALLFDTPCWATLGTERFARIELPPIVRELVLFLDNDKGGHRAEMLARKAFGASVAIYVRTPRRVGYDWNDVLLRCAAKGLREEAAGFQGP